jgi:hypothetical protein
MEYAAEEACVGESTVYRVLSDADLLSRWKRSTLSSGEYNFRPNGPNQQWHTDCMYVWVTARFHFLLSFVYAFSRYVVHHKLLISLDGQSVAVELQALLETAKDAKPRVVHDHCSEFVNRDVAAVIKTHNLIDIKTKPLTIRAAPYQTRIFLFRPHNAGRHFANGHQESNRCNSN